MNLLFHSPDSYNNFWTTTLEPVAEVSFVTGPDFICWENAFEPKPEKAL
jgi:hypothetical protein